MAKCNRSCAYVHERVSVFSSQDTTSHQLLYEEPTMMRKRLRGLSTRIKLENKLRLLAGSGQVTRSNVCRMMAAVDGLLGTLLRTTPEP